MDGYRIARRTARQWMIASAVAGSEASVILLAGAFVALWAGSALLLSLMPWFKARSPLVDRVAPYAEHGRGDWVDDIETWLGGRRGYSVRDHHRLPPALSHRQ